MLRFRGLTAGILPQLIILCLCCVNRADETGTKTKDMKFKLLSGDLMPLVGCKITIRKIFDLI